MSQAQVHNKHSSQLTPVADIPWLWPKKVLDNTKLEGQMALGLIEGAKAPPPTATRGSIVNTYA